MKKISAFLLVVIMSALAVFAAGCKKEDAISVLTLPDKCAFYVGEKVDVTGGKIKLVIGEEEQIVDMTQDMVAYTCDEDGISNILFPDNPFDTSGKKIVTIKHSDLYATYVVYVDDNLDNYKAYCYSRLDELAKNELSDGASMTAIADAKIKIAEGIEIDKVRADFELARDFVTEYYSIKVEHAERDASAEAVEKALEEMDILSFSLDQKKAIEESLEKLRDDIAATQTKKEVDDLYSAFEKEIADMRADTANEFVAKIEQRFAEEYETKKDYYTEQKYKELLAALVKYEQIIRSKETEDEMKAVENLLFETELPAVYDLVDIIYDGYRSLVDDGVVFKKHKKDIDEANRDILAFIEKIENVIILDVNKDDRTDVRDILYSDNYMALQASQAFMKHEQRDLLKALDAVMDEYEALKKANEEAPKIISAISGIGTVSLGSGTKIENARKLFDEWCDKYSLDEDNENIELITNYKTLTSAESTFDSMPANAKRDAELIREYIDDILDNGVIYSNGRKGIGEDLVSAEEEYKDWIVTYGKDFAEEYINKISLNYIDKLEEIRDKYDKLVEEAERILNEVTLFNRYADNLRLDSTFNSTLEGLEKDRLKLVEAREAFEEQNKGVSDVLDVIDDLPLEIDKRVFELNRKACIEAVNNESYKYVDQLTSTSDKNKIKNLAKEGEDALNAIKYNEKLIRYENVNLLEEEKNNYIVKLAKKFEALK